MKKKILIGSTVAVAGLVVIMGISSLVGGNLIDGKGKVIAKTKYGNIYESNIANYITKIEMITGNKVSIDSLQKEELEFITKDIVVQKKLAKQARKSPVTKKPEVKEKVKNATDNILKTEYLSYVAEKNITNDQIKAKYDSLKKSLEGKKEYEIKHILVKTKEDAQEATRMLYSKSFEDVAQEVSLDPGTAKQGGKLGYLVLESLDKDFAEKVKSQPVGRVSTPFKTQFGWHIIIVDDVRDAQPEPYENVKANLAQQMRLQYVNDYIKDMFDNIEVELVDQSGSEKPKEAEVNKAKDSEK